MNRVRFARALTAAGLALLGATLSLAATDGVLAWQSLTASQKQILAPLERDWRTLEPNRRQKWIEVAARFPAMPADERARVQERMAEWARLTPAQRTQARMQFQEFRQLPAEERQAKWQAYQALTEDQRRQLALSAKPGTQAATPVEGNDKAKATRPPTGSASSPTARAVAPILVQAHPGATTTTMTTRSAVPSHRVAGAPKIAATAPFVDPATLLPRRATPPPAPAASEAPADQP